MPATIEAVRAYATVGEISVALRDVYGIYKEPALKKIPSSLFD